VHALKDLATLTTLADRCGEVHQSYSDLVMLGALLAARGSEISGLQVGDIDGDQRIVTIRRQTYPGAGGLVTKQTKGRDIRHVPILQALTPVVERLTHDREPDERLLTGPRGGVLTTASVRDATKWDQLVTELELPSLTRHGLRHTGATWLADAGIPLHVLQGILGHKSIETTRGYLHPDTRHLTDAAARANAFLDGHENHDRDSPVMPSRTTAPRR
jgi:integrase